MSPEQLRHRPTTRRADVWAFGCICFEVLTGRPAFARDTLLDTAMAVLAADPDWSLLPDTTPNPLRTLVRRCLHKDENERLRDLGDVRILLDEMVEELEGPAQTVAALKPAPRRPWLLVVAALAAGAAGVGLARWFPPAPSEPSRVKKLTASGHDSLPAVSPDRHLIALASDRDGRSRIWLKELSTGGEQAVTEGHDTLPQF
jgi:serine/threonine-protein kinase